MIWFKVKGEKLTENQVIHDLWTSMYLQKHLHFVCVTLWCEVIFQFAHCSSVKVYIKFGKLLHKKKIYHGRGGGGGLASGLADPEWQLVG